MNHGERQTLPSSASLAKPTHCSAQSETAKGTMRLAQRLLVSDHLSAFSKQLSKLSRNTLKLRNGQRQKTYLSRIHSELRHGAL